MSIVKIHKLRQEQKKEKVMRKGRKRVKFQKHFRE